MAAGVLGSVRGMAHARALIWAVGPRVTAPRTVAGVHSGCDVPYAAVLLLGWWLRVCWTAGWLVVTKPRCVGQYIAVVSAFGCCLRKGHVPLLM